MRFLGFLWGLGVAPAPCMSPARARKGDTAGQACRKAGQGYCAIMYPCATKVSRYFSLPVLFDPRLDRHGRAKAFHFSIGPQCICRRSREEFTSKLRTNAFHHFRKTCISNQIGCRESSFSRQEGTKKRRPCARTTVRRFACVPQMPAFSSICRINSSFSLSSFCFLNHIVSLFCPGGILRVGHAGRQDQKTDHEHGHHFHELAEHVPHPPSRARPCARGFARLPPGPSCLSGQPAENTGVSFSLSSV